MPDRCHSERSEESALAYSAIKRGISNLPDPSEDANFYTCTAKITLRGRCLDALTRAGAKMSLLRKYLAGLCRIHSLA